MTPRVEIVIDELVVRGLAPGDARAAAAALEARLAELAGGAGPWRAEPARGAPRVVVPAGSPESLGNAVAGAVWSAVNGGSER